MAKPASEPLVIVDALVLAGGRSARLGSTPKATLVVDGRSLLEHTLAAARSARRAVVVGPPDLELPSHVLRTQEQPPYSGPVAGIAAGLAALGAASDTVSDATLVLACDMPRIADAVEPLLRALRADPDTDGSVAVDATGHTQPLAAVYRTAALSESLDTLTRTGSLENLPVFRMLDTLNLSRVATPPHSTADVDTWDDAAALDAVTPTTTTERSREQS